MQISNKSRTLLKEQQYILDATFLVTTIDILVVTPSDVDITSVELIGDSPRKLRRRSTKMPLPELVSSLSPGDLIPSTY